MTLLLGLPGSGKSLLLKALSGQAKKDKRLRIEGQVLYNHDNINTLCVERSAAYVDQMDSHLGALTVRETLNFSARCRWVTKTRRGMWDGLAAKSTSHTMKPRHAAVDHPARARAGHHPRPNPGCIYDARKACRRRGHAHHGMLLCGICWKQLGFMLIAHTAVHALPGLGCVCRHPSGLCLAARHLRRPKAARDPWYVAPVCVTHYVYICTNK